MKKVIKGKVKARRAWPRNPVTRVKESIKIYKRKKEKIGLKKEFEAET